MITDSHAWQALSRHYQQQGKHFDMRQLFADDADRAQRFSLSDVGLFLDYSKNRINDESLSLLLALANEVKLGDKIDRMFAGDVINVSEKRPVLHVAMRHLANTPIKVSGQDVMPAIRDVLSRMREFSHQVRSGRYLGASNKTITDIVNISIGGSHLGPQMVVSALDAYRGDNNLRCHFVANVDSTDIVSVLNQLNPETTLFIVGSKSFTTIETMVNAEAAKQWLTRALGEQAVATHFVAATTNVEAAAQFGIVAENIFEFWPWVGGRFSVWSSIGLVVMLAIGPDHFDQLLAGAYAMDKHFQQTDVEKNLPVILGLLGIWYHNFFAAETQAVVCYDQYLQLFSRYLQQVDMESNGKCVNEAGEAIAFRTGPVVWGDCGTNSQHSFHQLFHQGTHLVPIDFIFAANSLNPLANHQQLLLANGFAQAQALLEGKSLSQAVDELIAAGVDAAEAKRLAPYKVMPGNRPSNAIMMEKLTPHLLGALMALYEQKVFVQGAIWGIDSFDQFGVELGKVLANNILPALQGKADQDYDSSTQNLIDYYLRHQR